jgi:formylglycine-generating enzyme required for sulfatase activity
MKKVFILLGFALLSGGSSGEVLSNGPANGNVYECRVYDGTTSVPIEMVFVQGGTLQNKNTSGAIAVGDFYIGKYEVTQKQWLDVMRSYPEIPPNFNSGVGDNFPIYNVSWNDAQAFVTKLNAMNGGGNNFRLPTEAEWEYAAKGGSSQQSYTYAGSNTVDDVAWYSGNAGKTHAVGTKAANFIGIYDMSGNISEWCQDYYGGSSGESAIPIPTSTLSSARVIRGGGWNYAETNCTVSYRNFVSQTFHTNCGFRLVCRTTPSAGFSVWPFAGGTARPQKAKPHSTLRVGEVFL